MKRTTQLVLQSAIVGALLVLTVAGGSVGLSGPVEWTSPRNPNSVAVTHNPNALSLYYNSTLSLLGEAEFANVSQILRAFPFVNVAPRVNQSALFANSKIAAMNVSIANAMLSLNASRQQILAHQTVNASFLAKSGCAEADSAKSTFGEFVDSASPALTLVGVPAQPYSVGEGLVRAEIESLHSECQSLLGLLSYPSVNVTISSSQRTIVTGGLVSLRAHLTREGAALPGQAVIFYLNGSYIGRTTTVSGGLADANLSIPKIYKPLAVITAVVPTNDSIGIQQSMSNSLNFTILFTGTRIAIGDPSTYLPTFNLTVRGNLTTVSGKPLPRAPVVITFFNESVHATTNPTGVFEANLTVPADAPDGVAYVYAAFASQGAYGPSSNFTSVEVAHLRLKVTLDAPKLSLAGFATTISGTVEANGTTLPGAAVSVTSPWGEFHTYSDAAGRYAVPVPVSISEFAPAETARVSATASQAYIAEGEASARISLLNPLLIVLPVLAVGVTVYELDGLGLVPRRRRHVAAAESATERRHPASAHGALGSSAQLSDVVRIYLEAVTLASRKLGVEFKESATIREMIGTVEELSKTSATSAFSNVLMANEDLLYSRTFDWERVHEAEDSLAILKELWGS